MKNEKTAHEIFKDHFHENTVKKGTLKPGDFYLSTKNESYLYMMVEQGIEIKIEVVYGNLEIITSKNPYLEVYPEKK